MSSSHELISSLKLIGEMSSAADPTVRRIALESSEKLRSMQDRLIEAACKILSLNSKLRENRERGAVAQTMLDELEGRATDINVRDLLRGVQNFVSGSMKIEI